MTAAGDSATPAGEVRVRAARESDIPALCALDARVWSDTFAADLAPADVAAELAVRAAPAHFAAALHAPDMMILVAETPGHAQATFVGYAELGPVMIDGVDAGPADRALHRLYVETARQGRGIGGALLAGALAAPMLTRAPRVFLQVWERNRAALHLYARAGFARWGEVHFQIGAETVTDLVLVRTADATAGGPASEPSSSPASSDSALTPGDRLLGRRSDGRWGLHAGDPSAD